jgi:hypothetical protein
MKRKLVILVIGLFFGKIYSQNFRVEYIPGLGLYSMKDLKNINTELLKQLPFKAALTDNFPPYFYHKVACVFEVDSLISAGIIGAFYTTGSRISRKDYSGEYKFDQTIFSYVPGLTIRFKNYSFKLKFEEYNNLCYSFTQLDLLEQIQIDGDSNTEKSSIKSQFFEIESGVNISYNLYEKFDIGLSFSYLIDIKSDFGIIKNYNPNLAGWTGFKFGLYTSYRF